MNEPATEPKAAVIQRGRMVSRMYMISLRPRPGIDGIKAVRKALKMMKACGLHCTAVVEYNEGHDDKLDRFADSHSDGIRHLPVVDKGKVIGVVSIRDLLSEAVKHNAKIIQELELERLTFF